MRRCKRAAKDWHYLCTINLFLFKMQSLKQYFTDPQGKIIFGGHSRFRLVTASLEQTGWIHISIKATCLNYAYSTAVKAQLNSLNICKIIREQNHI